MELFVKNFNELTLDELYDILKLRINVFVVEQECPYPECDDFDKIAAHLFIVDNNKIVAYTRVLAPDSRYKEPSIGRVIVNSEKRGSGFGYKIMNESIDYIKKEFQSDNIKIQAQAYLEKFYSSLGFKKISEEYLEDDIPHIDMMLYL
jgi:ElaA protein